MNVKFSFYHIHFTNEIDRVLIKVFINIFTAINSNFSKKNNNIDFDFTVLSKNSIDKENKLKRALIIIEILIEFKLK